MMGENRLRKAPGCVGDAGDRMDHVKPSCSVRKDSLVILRVRPALEMVKQIDMIGESPLVSIRFGPPDPPSAPWSAHFVCCVRTRRFPAILHRTAPLRLGRKMAFGLGSSAGPHPRCTSLYTSGVPHHLWNGDVEWGVAATSFFLASGAHLGSRGVNVR